MAPDAQRTSDDEIDLLELWNVVWSGRWLIIGITLLFAISGVVYALMATEWYQARVVMVPAEEKSTEGVGAQLGGLASMVGISVGGGGTVEPVAVLKSRDFARQFIEDLELMPVLLANDWDAATGKWKAADPEDWPDVRDAVTYFHDNVLHVSENVETGILTLSVEWTDPDSAAYWANTLVRRLNDRMRAQALNEARRNVGYLQKEMGNTTVVTLQQSIANLLESELQKSMLAQGNEDFAYRVVDSAEVPNRRSKPNRVLAVFVATLLGGIASMAVIWIRSRRKANQTEGGKLD